MQNQQKWYQQPATVVVFLIFFFPVGLYLMWKYDLWSKTARVIVSVFFGLVVFWSVNSKKFKSKNNYNSYDYHMSTRGENQCDDMGSYNQGLQEGRLQKGMLIDCEGYYPYEGWADNKECYCKGFQKGMNE